MIDVKKDFSAVGDGIADDTDALQNALDSLKDSGGEIVFPKGVYKTTACLIFYSHQTLRFCDGAVLLRGNDDGSHRYLLASYTEPEQEGYTACHDAVVDGACFDGNKDIDIRITMMNTCHAKNIVIKKCVFKNGCLWHYIEINSSENVVVDGCIFEASYSTDSDKGEQVQLDYAAIGSYGPIVGRGGEVLFSPDRTVCRQIEIKNCVFHGYSHAPAIGNHGNAPHHHVKIHGNTFIGSFGHRGPINFVDMMTDIEIIDNVFSD